MNGKEQKIAEHSEPSKESFEELPEVDFEHAEYLGRGLYAHLRHELEQSGNTAAQITSTDPSCAGPPRHCGADTIPLASLEQ